MNAAILNICRPIMLTMVGGMLLLSTLIIMLNMIAKVVNV